MEKIPSYLRNEFLANMKSNDFPAADSEQAAAQEVLFSAHKVMLEGFVPHPETVTDQLKYKRRQQLAKVLLR